MPKVDGKSFPYSKKGKEAAKKAMAKKDPRKMMKMLKEAKG